MAAPGNFVEGEALEVAKCDPDLEGEWDGEWERCELIADKGDGTCDLRIISDGDECRGVPTRLVRRVAVRAKDGRPARARGAPQAIYVVEDRAAAARVDAPDSSPQHRKRSAFSTSPVRRSAPPLRAPSDSSRASAPL